MPVSPSCRLCNSANEIIFHLLSTCPYLAGTQYVHRHNSVALSLHRGICSHYGFQTCEKPWMYAPQPVIESKDIKILWDFEVKTDHVISARRPDIIVLDYQKKCGLLINVSIPANINIIEKEKEKILKYQDLRIELQKLWNIKLKVIPGGNWFIYN